MTQDGIVFIWLAWILFIVFTFFYKKTDVRLLFAIFILLMLSSVNKQVNVLHYETDMSLIVLSGFITYIYYKYMRKIYVLSCTVGAAFGFAGLFIWIQVFSITLFISMQVLFPLISIFLVGFLAKDFKVRLFILVSSATLGKFIYDAVLVNYGFQNTIGSKAFLDELMITVIIFLIRDMCSVLYKRFTTEKTLE